MKLTTFRKIRLIVLILAILIFAPGVNAQMPVAPGGLIQINPPFEGCELIWSSATILAYNWYGEYRLDVVPGAPGVGLWEAGVSYRGGAASLEPIAAQDGVVILAQDATATWYNVRVHDGTDNVLDSNLGDWQMWMTGVGSRLEIYAPGQVPPVGGGAPSNNQVFIGHDGADGVVGTAAGDLEWDAFADVYTNDDFGINIAAPTEALHVVGNPRFVTGAEGVGTIWSDDGTGTGVGEWASQAQLTGGIWFLYDTASTDIAGYDTLFADPSVGGVQSYNIAIPASPTLIEEFATEVGEPGVTFISAGILVFHFDARRSAGTMDCSVYAEIYTRTDPIGVETLLCTTEESNFLTNAQQVYEIHAVCPERALNATDRLVVKVYGNQYPPGANPTIQFYVEGVTGTRIELPGAEAGTGMAHVMVNVPIGGADPTSTIVEAGVSEQAMDFQVEVNCHDLNSDTVWPALGSRMPVADLITYYWEVTAALDLTVHIVNDSQTEVQAMIWWGR